MSNFQWTNTYPFEFQLSTTGKQWDLYLHYDEKTQSCGISDNLEQKYYFQFKDRTYDLGLVKEGQLAGIIEDFFKDYIRKLKVETI
jgi:hypothetical protein